MRRSAVFLLWPAGTLAADLPGDPHAGEQFAREVCGVCHLVAEDAPDPSIGPSFYEVAEFPGTTEMSLRAFLQTPHATMPNLILTPQETDDVISYILTLKGG
jgi:mono/diheme cytochrome c family protein